MRILFGSDGSQGAGLALDLLLSLPLSEHDDVTVLSAARGTAAGLEHAERIADLAVRQLAERGARATSVVREGSPVNALFEIATERDVDLVVVGSRGLGALRGALFGSTARALARLCPVPLLVVRGKRARACRVLVAVDDEGKDQALAVLRALPLPVEVDITVTQATGAREVLALAERYAKDLIVIGSREDPLGQGWIHASVVDQVLSEAHCCVLIARSRIASGAGAIAGAKETSS